MKAHLFGNRRRLRCVYGSPGLPYSYIPFRYVAFANNRTQGTTPEWRHLAIPRAEFSPDEDDQVYLLTRHEERGVGVTVNTHAGLTELTSGIMRVSRAESPAQAVSLEIAEGRHRPAAIADFTLITRWENLYDDLPFESWGPHHTVVPLRYAGGVICFLEKTASGYGSRYIRLALRELYLAEDAPSSAASVCSLFTVSSVDGDSEEVLHAATVPYYIIDRGPIFTRPIRSVPGRVSLARNGDGDPLLYVSLLFTTESTSPALELGEVPHSISHTAVIPYSPPSVDATIFGAVRLPAGLPEQQIPDNYVLGDFVSSIIAAYESPVAGSGLRVVETTHDALVDVAFIAGAMGRPDFDFAGGVSTRADEIIFSEQPDRVVAGSVRCGADLYYPAPEIEVESTQLSPVIELGPVRQPFLAEMYAGSRQVVHVKALATTAHAIDRSGLAHHSSVAHALPPDGCVHLLGKKFSSAAVSVTLRGEGRVPEPYTYAWEQDIYAKTIPENQDIDIEQFYELTKGHHPTRSPLYSLPLGTFECTPFDVGGAPATPGMMRASLQQIDKQYSYVPQTPTLDPTNGLGWTIGVSSHAELVAIFSVALQESGTFASSDYIDVISRPFYARPLEYPINTWSPPTAPIGQFKQRAVFVPPAVPSPALVMQLFARTTTTITKSDSYNFTLQRPIPGGTFTSSSPSSPIPELGKFVFSKEQTAALMNGDEVRATTWLVSSPPPDGADVGERGGRWPQASRLFEDIFFGAPGAGQFWMNFKLRLNIDG